MGNNYFTDPLVFLVQALFGLYCYVIVLRFFLQIFRADFYNPISQLIVKATAPLLRPLRRLIPGLAGMDLASLVLAWLVKTLELTLIWLLVKGEFQLFGALAWSIPELVGVTINLFLIAVVILAIVSWFAPAGYNPAMNLFQSLANPLLRPARRWLPPFSGIDLSPMLVGTGLVLLQMLLLPPLKVLTGSPF